MEVFAVFLPKTDIHAHIPDERLLSPSPVIRGIADLLSAFQDERMVYIVFPQFCFQFMFVCTRS